MNLNSLVSSLGVKGSLVGDISFLILFLLASFVVSLVLGKHRILVSLLGVYAAYVVVSLANFDLVRDPQTKSLFFLAILIAFIVMFSRIIRGSVSGHGPIFYAKLIIGTAIVIGLSLTIIIGWYSAKDLAGIVTPNVRYYFSGDLFRLLWGIAPLVYLGIVRKRID
ncbi:MAG TPA: hypothetical protein VK254_01815 [Candidatus Bathyarchaeia archaeon]|nr:hypothetical protein [Candidatus Bathyarchaeia archaeon]